MGFPNVDTLLESTGENEKGTIFVYSGSTSAGLSVVQLAEAFGWKVVATASPHSFDLVKSFGADAVYNYRDANVGTEIATAHLEIEVAVDCYSEGKSTNVCDAVIAKNGGQVITLLPSGKSNTPWIKHELIIAYTVLGKEFKWFPPVGPKFPANPTDWDMLAQYYKILQQLTNVLKPLPIIHESRGVDSILPSLNKLRGGKVSGGKLVLKL